MKGIRLILVFKRNVPLLPPSQTKFLPQNTAAKVSTRRTRLIRTDIQISSVAAFSTGSDLRAFSILLTLGIRSKAEVASGRIAR